ncbi:HAMP domain-containing methyl-accepting chemotaxis protein [Natroniella sulfidigena]|uniref:methyl-accepting chemotaxis protein n=1 Tax=Natroniella sulfidigena TaxID=723921 RepID=UPI00200A787D|nr:HAMP domain-containing methyl-accepting chemotaxis protein [Natroniella sulfidigena]MCK8817082.1 HAMP domain-containing methyl-accepting chemotaxis protein [Natroniella sulfidigena]
MSKNINQLINLKNLKVSLRVKFLFWTILALLVGPVIGEWLNNLINQHIYQGEFSVYIATAVNTITITAVILYLTNRLIIGPVKKIGCMLEAMGEGDLDLETLDVKRNDEIGFLQRELNQMMINMTQMMERIDQATEKVNQISDDLSKASDESGEMAEQASAAIQQVASSSERQVSLVQNLAADLQNIGGATTDEEQVSIKDISQAANEGTEIINNAVNSMQEVNQTINQSATTVDQLNDYTQEISQFVDVITNIAEQTNLLALNASIEAARAGEHGQGFAVVAEEIRQLAVESNTAAEDIVDLIREMKERSENTVKAMKGGRSKAEAGMEIINQADDVFIDIKGRVNGMDSTLERLVSNVDEVASFTEEVAASAEQVAAISEEQSAEAQQTSAIADQLDQMISDLNGLTDKLELYDQ